ncbi:Hypothetical_protein [Hexamita inflata]|uniref:Hypothetical_protein n=1 Tax=Hexamita inflata TaxID=28002 RepID=A0AA86R6P2_9EUKA|nr:Hypothetical protein HINF_LOCUS60319 [Hexamita inflata]
MIFSQNSQDIDLKQMKYFKVQSSLEVRGEHEGLALVRIQNRTENHQKLRSSAKSPQKETQKKKEDKQPVSENPVKPQPIDGLNKLTIANAKQDTEPICMILINAYPGFGFIVRQRTQNQTEISLEQLREVVKRRLLLLRLLLLNRSRVVPVVLERVPLAPVNLVVVVAPDLAVCPAREVVCHPLEVLFEPGHQAVKHFRFLLGPARHESSHIGVESVNVRRQQFDNNADTTFWISDLVLKQYNPEHF